MSIHFNSLTSKQKKVYSAIETYLKTNGIPPTVREIGEMVGEKTPGAVQGILNRLEQKGVIKRQIGMARSIQLVSADNSLYASPVYIPEIKKVSSRNVDDLLNIYNITKYHPMSPDVVGPDEQCFIMNCPDNSLFESGISYGDTIIISTNCEYRNEDIVLILYDNHIYLRSYSEGEDKDTIILKADMDLLNKQTFNKSEVRIVGKVTGKYARF